MLWVSNYNDKRVCFFYLFMVCFSYRTAFADYSSFKFYSERLKFNYFFFSLRMTFLANTVVSKIFGFFLFLYHIPMFIYRFTFGIFVGDVCCLIEEKYSMYVIRKRAGNSSRTEMFGIETRLCFREKK